MIDNAVFFLCGGKGTRLWPISTDQKPKQFLKITNDETLLQNTLNRIPDNYIKVFISNVKYRSELEKYVSKNDIAIFEPISRNTGQAIYVACSHLKKKYNRNFNILVVPCDHLFDDTKFKIALNKGMSLLKDDNVVTFGIKPTYAETGFGYISKDEHNHIMSFVEKPTTEKANQLIKQGCLWNSGVFLFRLNSMLNLYYKFNQKSLNFCDQSLMNASTENNEVILDNSYNHTENISFDYLIMEKISTGLVLEYEGLWSDIGDWKRLLEVYIKDGRDNKIIGHSVEQIDTSGSLIYCDSGSVVTVGVSDLIVVKYHNNVLILNKDCNDIFKRFVQRQSEKNK